jgi:hypothetical protein
VSDAPDVWSASIPRPSDDWPESLDNPPPTLTTSSWLFPPRTGEVQFAEKWSFVNKKQKNGDPNNPADDQKGDGRDHVVFDPEHKRLLAIVLGAHVIENVELPDPGSGRIASVLTAAELDGALETVRFLRGELSRHSVRFKGLRDESGPDLPKLAEKVRVVLAAADPRDPDQVAHLS